jgi:hypothetical protein
MHRGIDLHARYSATKSIDWSPGERFEWSRQVNSARIITRITVTASREVRKSRVTMSK